MPALRTLQADNAAAQKAERELKQKLATKRTRKIVMDPLYVTFAYIGFFSNQYRTITD